LLVDIGTLFDVNYMHNMYIKFLLCMEYDMEDCSPLLFDVCQKFRDVCVG